MNRYDIYGTVPRPELGNVQIIITCSAETQEDAQEIARQICDDIDIWRIDE